MKYTEADLKKHGLVETSPGVYQKVGYLKSETKIVGVTHRLHTGEIKHFPVKEPINIFAAENRYNSILVIPGIVQGMNGSKGLMRGHWSGIKKQKELYCTIIAEHLRKKEVREHVGPVVINYIGHKSALMDWDNFCASFKHIGDSLVKMKIIKEDNPKVVIKFIPEQIKCKRQEQKVSVIIKDYIE